MNQQAGLMPMARSLGAAVRKETHMLKEAMQWLGEMAEPIFRVEEDGRTYTNRALHEVQAPEVKPIEVQTLAGFRDIYKLRDDTQKAIILIHDSSTVYLMAKELDEWRRRAEFAVAALPSDAPRFRFGIFLDPEEFIIGLQSLFEDADYHQGDHRKVLKLVSNLAAEAVTVSTDDGLSQQVVTRQGMIAKGEEKVSPRVTLSPYRTFREISQPTSEFVLRLRSRQGQMPMCALFEADGQEWKTVAMRRIRDYFITELPDAQIVA